MKLKILGCYGGRLPRKNATSFLLDGTVLIDAGSASSALKPAALKRIRHVLLSHGHLDHVGDLPNMGDMLIGPGMNTVEVIGSANTIGILSNHLMNGALWPDFARLPTPEAPMYRYRVESEGKSFKVGKYNVEFVPVKHTIPTHAMFIRGKSGTIMYTGDTGPTEQVWQVARAEKNLKAIITEISFPNALKDLSIMTGHMSPCHIDTELAKMGRTDVPVYIYHFKPWFEDVLLKEVQEIRYPHLRPLVQGETLKF